MADRIRELRKKRGLTQPEFAKTLGCSVASVQKWEAGAGISHRWLNKIAERFHVEVDYLISGKESAPTPEPAPKKEETTMMGDSMEPLLVHGDVLHVDHNDKALIPGRIYALLEFGMPSVRKIRFLSNGGKELFSDNPDYPPIPVSSNIEVLGTVTAFTRKMG